MIKNNEKVTLLVVDDDMAQREKLERMLSAEGFLVLTAPNGQKGLEAALQKTPDLILLDIAMPVMDGMAMMQKHKKRKFLWQKCADHIAQ